MSNTGLLLRSSTLRRQKSRKIETHNVSFVLIGCGAPKRYKLVYKPNELSDVIGDINQLSYRFGGPHCWMHYSSQFWPASTQTNGPFTKVHHKLHFFNACNKPPLLLPNCGLGTLKLYKYKVMLPQKPHQYFCPLSTQQFRYAHSTNWTPWSPCTSPRNLDISINFLCTRFRLYIQVSETTPCVECVHPIYDHTI